MVFLLCDGWASASRRSYTHSSLRVDCDSQPPQISPITSSLTGKNHAPDRARELALPAPVLFRPLLPMLLRTTLFCRLKPTNASFFSNLHALARGVLLNSCNSCTPGFSVFVRTGDLNSLLEPQIARRRSNGNHVSTRICPPLTCPRVKVGKGFSV